MYDDISVLSENEFLARLYMKHQDLTGKSPLEVKEMYEVALKQMDTADMQRKVDNPGYKYV